MAGKTNGEESDIDKTTGFWVQNCGICHPGGGPGEFDRDGHLLYDLATGEFGWEKAGRTAGEVALDGDYAFLNPTNGDVGMHPWDRTGLSEPDCLFCHRSTGPNWVARTGTLRGGAALVDGAGSPVPAFTAASAAGQGWAVPTMIDGVKPPKASALDIDYGMGLADGSLVADADGTLRIAETAVVGKPLDKACWGCHAIPEDKKRGRVWFDASQDVHYAAFNHLDDADPANDLTGDESRACAECHPSGADHEFAKGNAPLGSVRNDLDWQGFRTCEDCHSDGPDAFPGAPVPDGQIHRPEHRASMACQFCHIPYKMDDADLVVDNATTGSSIGYSTKQFLSTNPLNPGATDDDSRWYPSAIRKKGKDGVERLTPVKLLLSIWWGDWDDNGTPGDLSDDVVAPIALWRVRGVTAGQPLAGVTDDNGDGKPEVNRPGEILAYLTALGGTDRYGAELAGKPVLVKGGKIWYEDPANPGEILHLEYHGTGMMVESSHPFGIDHNVLPARVALGEGSCLECHVGGGSPVFDRLVLVDPFGEDGEPVYEPLEDLTGVSAE